MKLMCDPRTKQYPRFNRQQELELFHRWRADNDQQAYELLVESQIAWALQLVGRMVSARDMNDFDEAVSAAFEGVLYAVKKFDPRKGRLSNLVWRSVRTCVHRRDKGGMRRWELITPSNEPASKYDHELEIERREWITKAMGGLNRSWRLVLRRRYWDDWTLEEIGRELGVTKRRVWQIERNALAATSIALHQK